MDREQNTRRPTDDARKQRAAAQQVAAPQDRMPRRAAGAAINDRRGFTLVELLVTIAIIAILAGIILVAAQAAQQAANRANTQALIAKLHGQMMVRYESYRTRRLPINTAGLTAQQAALHRLNAVRELMRMELPDRYSDLMAYPNPNFPGSLNYVPNPLGLPSSRLIVAPFFTYMAAGTAWVPGTPPNQYTITPTAVNLSYQRKISANGVAPTADYEDAECLYLILNTGLTDDTVAGELINPENVGDADADGMPEFQDAWGRPIRFIRWAPGFISDLQPYDPVNSPNDPHFTAKNHDPFDPLKMQHPFPSANTSNDFQSYPSSSASSYISDGVHSWVVPDGKSLVPLVYSLGSDGIDDIQHPPVDNNGFAIASAVPAGNYFWCCQFHNYLSTPGTVAPVLSTFYVYDPFIVTAPPMPVPPASPAAPNYHFLSGEQSWRTVLSSAPSYPNNFVPVGAPSDTDGDGSSGGYADNITNHLLGQQ